MNRYVILCVEDEPEVRSALVRDIELFAQICLIEEAEDAADARDLVSHCLDAGDELALVLCDHLLPGESGVDFLVALNGDETTRPTRKVLVTGQAGLQDTVKAVNQAGLDHYVSEPWAKEDLQGVVRTQLTNFVVEHVDDLLPFVSVLDGVRLMEAMKERSQSE
ncbi:MAG: response regulator [Phycisphaerales bacterium]|nr:MAG: response regulator [Phycisphaerales bacterium]